MITGLTACGGGGGGDDEDEETVAVQIWYVDNRSAVGSGTSDDPFATLAQAQLAAMAGEIIYIANGDGTSTGLDTGLTLDVANVSVIGEGVALVVDGSTLIAAGTAPTITNPAGAGIILNAANNTVIKGLTIDAVAGDGLEVNNSTGVFVEDVTISNSGESAIQGSGADVGLSLTEVIIDTVDVVDPLVSDDAIFLAATSSSALVMSGGAIDGVPGNLGDGIEFENAGTANTVDMSLDIRGVSFSNIAQDGIKLDNDNGEVVVQIGGATVAEGNIFDVGFRGILIQTNLDPGSGPRPANSILVQNNNIVSGDEGIQIRSIANATRLSVLDNTLSRGLAANASGLVDVQAELGSDSQARINRNNINNATGSDGIKLRVFDTATLTMEALNNTIDGPDEGFDFDVIETDSAAIATTILNASVLNNTLSTIGNQAMNARNADTTSQTCLDLQGNTVLAQDYVVDAVQGSFELSAASQATVFDPAGGSFSGIGPCPVPVF